MREIFRSDTIGAFMDKCNENFRLIAESGGPKGETGETGETGARGRRGSTIIGVPAPQVEEGEEFTVEDAQNALNGMSIDDGLDVVVFNNGHVGYMIPDAEDDRKIGTIVDVFPIIGPEGKQGPAGVQGDSLLEGPVGGAVTLKNNYKLKINNSLELLNGGRIVLGGNSIFEENGLTLNGGSSGINLKSTGVITIGSSESIKVENGMTTIRSGSNEVKITNNRTEFTQATVFKKNIELLETNQKITFGGSSATNIKSDEISTQNMKSVTLGVYNPQYRNLIFDNAGFRIVEPTESARSVFSVGSNVNTTLDIKTSKTVKANNGDGEVLLDSPKYTMMVYPTGIDVPNNWTAFDKDLLIQNVTEFNGDVPANDGNDLYFKFNVKTVSGTSSSTVEKTFKISNFYANIGQASYSNQLFIVGENSGIDGLISGKANGIASIKDDISDIKENSATTRPMDLASPETISDIMRESSTLDIQAGQIQHVVYEFTVNYYAYFIKNMLSRTGSDGSTRPIRNMTSVFTRIFQKNKLGEIIDGSSFIFPKPQSPTNGLVWIFKHN